MCIRDRYYTESGIIYSANENVVFEIDSFGVLQPIGYIDGNNIVYFGGSKILKAVCKNPFIIHFFGRVTSVEVLANIDFNPYGITNMLSAKKLTIATEDQNIFSVEVVVLPDSVLDNDPAQNYFECNINGVSRKYFLESFSGIPIVNRIKIEDLDTIETIEVIPNAGIVLEYHITATYPQEP